MCVTRTTASVGLSISGADRSSTRISLAVVHCCVYSCWFAGRRQKAVRGGTDRPTKAAELAGMSVWDFAQLAKERDITWVADDHLDADLEAL